MGFKVLYGIVAVVSAHVFVAGAAVPQPAFSFKYGDRAVAGGASVQVDSRLKVTVDAREYPEYDAVVGSRVRHPEGYAGYSFSRKVVSKTYLRLLRVWGGLSLSDSQTGLKGFRNPAAQRIFSLCTVDRFAFDYEAIKIGQMLGFRFGELPVKIVNHRPSTIRFFRDTRRMLKDISKTKKRLKRLKKDLKNKEKPE